MRGIKKIFYGAGRFVFESTSPLWARLLKISARTGWGTDRCIENGFIPMPVHYYSPIPDINDLSRRKVWDRRSEMVGVDFQPEKQVKFLRQLGQEYSRECNWPAHPSADPDQFYSENNSFSYGCAAALHSIIRHFKPQRILEIGSGNSSRVISSALTINQTEGIEADYTIIDPYPAPLTKKPLPCLTQVIQERVELSPLDPFTQLGDKDILFIDSGHTVRTGGDVNFLFLEVLPRLAPGVIVHIHDINMPDEYPSVYFTNPGFRMFWTESYLLQAFLSFNREFEVLLGMHYLMGERLDDFCQAFPLFNPDLHQARSGSFWMRRKKNSANVSIQ